MLEIIVRSVLQNRLLVCVMGLMVMAAGFFGYEELPVDAFPDVSPNLVQIFTLTDGLAPEEIEKYVTYPVEAAMNGLPKVTKVRSVSNFGLSVVNVYFADDMNIYLARQLVGERLVEAREQIPDGFGDPGMGPISTGMGLILFYYLKDDTGKRSLTELREMQDWIVKFNLQTVPGVTEILGIGGHEKQFDVVVRPEALLRYDVTIGQVIKIIRANNINVGAQFLTKNSEEYVVRSEGLATSIADLGNIVIKADNGSPVFLRQLADLRIGGAIRRGLQTRNGEGEVVSGMVIKLFGANSSTVISAVEDKIVEVNKMLPKGVHIVPYYQQKDLVESCVSTVRDALVQGIALVAIIIFVFMGAARPSLVVALSIPFSVLFALLGMYIFNISANLMSFGGLAIAIGMMVDGTIVIVENVDRRLREAPPEQSHLAVIISACLQVGQPILFAIAIIIIVFLPLFTLQGVEGKTFRPLAYSVALAMFGSLIYAIFIAPVLSYFLMRRPAGSGDDHDNDVFIVRLLKAPYLPLVTRFVKKRSLSIIGAVGLLVVGALVFPRLGSEFTPRLQEGTLILRLSMAPSIAIGESKRVALIVEKRLMTVPEVIGVVSRIGRGEVGAHADPINSAEMYIILKEKADWRVPGDQKQVLKDVRAALGEVPGVLTNFTQPIAMSVDELMEGVRAELAIKLFGDDLKVLKEKADEIAAIVNKVPGGADVQADQITGTPQVLIKVNRQAIALYGINIAEVQETIRAAIGGANAGQIFEGIRRFGILVRYPKKDRDTLADIGNLLIQSPDGARVPLSQLAELKELVGPRQITRERNQRFISVQCNVVGRDIGSFVKEAQGVIASKIKLPPGYFIEWGGQFRLQEQANKRLAVVVPITLAVVFFLLFMSFNSLKNTLLILLNIPLALVGGVLALWISGQNLSVPSSVGFIALFGIALENGMVLVTYLNQLVRDGVEMDKACIRGAVLRLRPVLMTAITTGLGLLPLLMSTGTGSEVQRPLATVVVGGLVTSTILTLLVIPALYKFFSVAPEQAHLKRSA